MKLKTILTTGVLLQAVVLGADAFCAAGYTDYVSLRGTGVTAIDAFMTNVVDLTKGWSDERDPHPDADYVVKGDSRLATPLDDATATCYEFPGRSLTIDTTFNANRGLHFYTRNDASVKFERLTLRGGVIACAYASATPQTICGDVVVDLSDKSKSFRFSGGTGGMSWHFKAGSLSAGVDDVLETHVDYNEKSGDYWVHSDVDASAYYGTFRSWWKKKLNIECPRFGGTAEAAATGIVAYAANNVSISSVWLSAEGAQLMFGANGYSAFADRLALTAGTRVTFRSGTTLTVGTLDSQGGTLDFTNGGLLALTNGYSRSDPIEVVVPLAATALRTSALVTMPVTVGVLKAEDFTAAQIVGNCQYQFRVHTKDGVQSLYLENLLPGGTGYTKYQKAEEFVHQIIGGYSGSSPTDAFSTSGAWSNATDGVSVSVPTSAEAADLDYEGVRLGFWGSQSVDFKGRSFTYSGYPLRATGNATTYVFPDMRVFAGSSASYCPTFYCSAGKPNVTFRGMMTVLCKTTDSYPLRICPCTVGKNTYGVYNMQMKIVGDSTRCFRLCDYGETAAVGAVTNVVKFTGDLSAYAGAVIARKNVQMSLGGDATDMPGTVVLDDASARLTLDDISVSLGTLRTTAAARVEIPEGQTLTVTESLELADGTTLTATAGEPVLDLRTCSTLSFAGTVNLPLTMPRSVKKAPVALVKDGAAAETLKSAFRVLRNGRRPTIWVSEAVTGGLRLSVVAVGGFGLIFR